MYSTVNSMDLSLIADPVIIMSVNPGSFDSVRTMSEQPLGFSFSDLRSAERVLTMSSLDLTMAAESADLTIACCCTPCCCAVAVMQPVPAN